MAKILAVVYCLVAHVMFLLVFVYLICFLGDFDFLVPKTIDSGTAGPVGMALIINLLLLGLFAVPHSIMARPGFKEWWTPSSCPGSWSEAPMFISPTCW